MVVLFVEKLAKLQFVRCRAIASGKNISQRRRRFIFGARCRRGDIGHANDSSQSLCVQRATVLLLTLCFIVRRRIFPRVACVCVCQCAFLSLAPHLPLVRDAIASLVSLFYGILLRCCEKRQIIESERVTIRMYAFAI